MVMTRRTALGTVVAGLTAPATGMPSPAWSQAAETPFMKVEFGFSGNAFTATLFDNPSARDFASMLPLTLKIDDNSTNEKIAYLPRKLKEAGGGPFGNEAPGDLAYYAPWGNLIFYHADYHYSRGPIRLGRLSGGIRPLLKRGQFPLTAKAAGWYDARCRKQRRGIAIVTDLHFGEPYAGETWPFVRAS